MFLKNLIQLIYIHLFSPIVTFSVEDHRHMGWPDLFELLAQGAQKAQSSVNGKALGAEYSGRHSIKHLKQQIHAIHNQQFVHILLHSFGEK